MAASAQRVERPEARASNAGLRAGLVAALLFAAGILGPTAGLPGLALLATLAPFPLSLARLQVGAAQAWLAATLAAGLVGSVASMSAAATFALAFAVPGLLIGTAMARGRGMLRGCFWAGAWMAALIAIWLPSAGSRLISGWLTQIDSFGSQPFLERLRAEGVSLEILERIREAVGNVHSTLALAYPAVSIIVGLSVVGLNAAILRAYLKLYDPGWLEDGEFERLRWPFSLAVLFVAASLTFVAPPLRSVSINALLLAAFLFALQGLAVVAYFSRRLVPPIALWLAGITLFVTHPLAPVAALALLGLFDNWLNARRWADPPAEAD